MNNFVIVAACMAVVAAAAMALPLLRDRRSRLVGVVAAVLLMGAAAGLYPLWSNFNWHPAPVAAASASPDVSAMVAKLERHLQAEPTDMTGWLMLGRSYMAMERFDDAATAYDRARNLGKSSDAALGLGEAMTLRAGGQISPAAAELFEEALTLAPGNPKALLYGGFGAVMRGDKPLARSRWLALKELHPPPQIDQLLDARIAELGLPEAAGGTSASQAGTNTQPQGSAPGRATVNISISPTLRARVKDDTALFVFAREPGQAGPPLAVKRLTAAAIGSQVELSAADSMLQGHALAVGQKVSVTARVSFRGQPIAVAGDLYGEVAYEVGRDGVLNLLIDRVAE
jgi:cytochrome c-type biogenesis protein CcmH